MRTLLYSFLLLTIVSWGKSAAAQVEEERYHPDPNPLIRCCCPCMIVFVPADIPFKYCADVWFWLPTALFPALLATKYAP